jgi:hypothetical protein
VRRLDHHKSHVTCFVCSRSRLIWIGEWRTAGWTHNYSIGFLWGLLTMQLLRVSPVERKNSLVFSTCLEAAGIARQLMPAVVVSGVVTCALRAVSVLLPPLPW